MVSIDLSIKIITMTERAMVRDITATLGCISFVIVFSLQKLSKGLIVLTVMSIRLWGFEFNSTESYELTSRREKVYKMSVLGNSSTKCKC